MKKFAIVITSILVLFVFLMLNYLVWDKENLQNQRDSDKIEQDWLRGENRILNTTVEELENSVSILQKTAEEQRAKIRSMEEETRALRQNQLINQKDITLQIEALNVYKSLFTDDLKEITRQWFNTISNNRLEDSLLYLDKEFKFWGRKYIEEEYIEFISAIEYIEIRQESGNDPFIIIEGGQPHIVKAHVDAYINIDGQLAKNITELVQGQNSLEIGFSYNSLSKSWLILYIDTENIVSP